eukprot:3343670-Rhodomonas_salina.8
MLVKTTPNACAASNCNCTARACIVKTADSSDPHILCASNVDIAKAANSTTLWGAAPVHTTSEECCFWQAIPSRNHPAVRR